MTMAEMRLATEAYQDGLRTQQRHLAWHASNIMNVWTKRRIRPSDLLRERGPRAFGRHEGKEAVAQHFRRKRERAAAKADAAARAVAGVSRGP